MNRQMYITFRGLELELMRDDPDLEAILYSIITACMEHKVRFSFEYWHLSDDTEPIRVLFDNMMWSFYTVEEAIRWTIDYAIKEMEEQGVYVG